MPIPTFAAGATPTAAQLNSALSAGFPVGIDAWTGFTPTLTQSVTVTKTINDASYMKIGRMVTVAFYLVVTGTGTAANVVSVGLPVAAAAIAAANSVGAGVIFDSSAGLIYQGSWTLTSATTMGLFVQGASGTLAGATGGIFTAAVAVGDQIRGTVTYQSAA